jgi:predicted HAD superfamily Cof-like phosphohydrolase
MEAMTVRDTIARVEADPANDHTTDVVLSADEWRNVLDALTMGQSYYQDIYDFHEKFKLAYDGPPRGLDLDLSIFRTNFMAEELLEYAGLYRPVLIDLIKKCLSDPDFEIARKHVSLEDKLDALVDLVYVVLGTAHMHGFDFDEAWRRVHEANMGKVRARRDEESSRGSAKYDIVKPEGWRPADLSDLVQSVDLSDLVQS